MQDIFICYCFTFAINLDSIDTVVFLCYRYTILEIRISFNIFSKNVDFSQYFFQIFRGVSQ